LNSRGAFAPREQSPVQKDKISHALMWAIFEQSSPKIERMISR
jgi:hypothetical protein